MTDFQINFSNPWLLLLLIPSVIITLVPYFRLNKRYRRNRNRITSIVLHSVIMVLSIAVLAGIGFSYNLPNRDNEVIVLVDLSFSSEEDKEDKDEFVRSIIDQTDKNFKLGVVTFGYDTVYASTLSYDNKDAYNDYVNAELPNTSATDISKALTYAKNLFTKPESGKIILISDGLETDGDAATAVKNVAAEGVKVDVAYFSTPREGDDAQLTDITFPDTHIAVGDAFNITLTLKSSYEGTAYITLYDNDTADEAKTIQLAQGEQTLEVEHRFNEPGLHKIYFGLESSDDDLLQNNGYYSYFYLQVYDKLLVVERTADESKLLSTMLSEKYGNDKVNVVTVTDTQKMPKTVEDLQEYDQVILSNIANADMPEGFIESLHSYVYDIGGALMTVGGNKVENGEEVANMYNREDLYGTLYQEMLPVQAVNYTPPLGVVIIIDRSGSMADKLQNAKDGAISCVSTVLEDRDWCGIMTLETTYNEEISLTPMTQSYRILSSIDNIEIGGGTMYGGAIERAGRALLACDQVERRHVILVTDGEPGDPGGVESIGQIIQDNYNRGVTFSMVVVGGGGMKKELQAITEEMGHGKYYEIGTDGNVAATMRGDLQIPEITEISKEPFTPKIAIRNAVTKDIDESLMPQLYGYYGTRKKSDAIEPLKGEFVPIFAQWQYGKGMVGSFMCDLNGTWSGEFVSSDTGRQLIYNMVDSQFPMNDIRPSDVTVELTEDNYSTRLSIYTDLEYEESIEVEITRPPQTAGGEGEVEVLKATASDNYSRRITFENLQAGIHKVVVKKLNGNGEVISTATAYRSFSWSAEYDCFADEAQGEELLKSIAESGEGKMLTLQDISGIFADVIKKIHKTVDPRAAFLIIAIVLFLLDLAARKFKFKWIHELIRERKEKKNKS